uniref:Phosphatidylinositol 4-kinase beta n=1 Tax=Angiostrongylus cantonensis TaxID=6313 RepID=A0A158PBX5_ANGCA
MKAESSKVTKRNLSPETLELIHQRGIARAAGNRDLTSELAKQCRQVIKEDLKERTAAGMDEAAEAGKSIRKARRSLANYKTKMIALRRPDGIVTASRKARQKIAYEFYSDLFDSRADEYIVPPRPLTEPPSLLMRLFESCHFSPAIAVKYLFSSSERGVKQYLGKKLFSFSPSDIDFFVPQLICMYINDKDVANAIHQYIEARCRESYHFALICVWLLESLGVDRLRNKDRVLEHGEILRRMILNEFKPPISVNSMKPSIRMSEKPERPLNASLLNPENLNSGLHLTRSESAATALRFLSPAALGGQVGECVVPNFLLYMSIYRFQAHHLEAQKNFVSWLTRIGDNLREEATKEEKTRRLVSELLVLNMHLPARVWIPLSENHIVLNIPPTNGCVLNSKDKAPYCIFVEVLHSVDARKIPLPKRPTFGEENLHMRLRSSSFASVESSFTNPDMTDVKTSSFGVSTMDLAAQTSVDMPVDNTKFLWDTKSLDSCVSCRGTSGISHRFKKWLKRPARKRQMLHHPDDPSASTMSEPWDEKKERIRQASPYGGLSGWDLFPVIVKSGDDLLQELLAYQLLEIWEEEEVPLFLRPYKIVVTSPNSGMIEPIVDACSLHQGAFELIQGRSLLFVKVRTRRLILFNLRYPKRSLPNQLDAISICCDV